MSGSTVLASSDGSTIRRYAGVSGKVDSVVTLSPALRGAYRAFEFGNGLLLAGTDTRMYQ
jgi:hypothetical protein